ncbi:MAG TPA: hypothetical protein VHL77_10750 [Ferruginibacter sp.]|nr:hypothetical protein [Ferruginibacter sp.]
MINTILVLHITSTQPVGREKERLDLSNKNVSLNEDPALRNLTLLNSIRFTKTTAHATKAQAH